MGDGYYDLAVIGGGTAGLRIAIASANSKQNTVLVERGQLGGTCLNTGCIPTKAMLHASKIFSDSKHLGKFGIEAHGLKVDFRKLMQRIQDVIKEGREEIAKTIKIPHLTIIHGSGRFCSRDAFRVGRKEIHAHNFIIASGSKNFVPDIPGLGDVKYMCHEDVLKLRSLPKSMTIIGGGYISLEYATFFAELGTRVIVIEHGPHILSMLDYDVADLLMSIYMKKGVRFMRNTNTERISKKGIKIQTMVSHNEKHSSFLKTIVESDSLLVATGRVPDTETLNLEAAAVKTGNRGEVIVNERLQTTNPRVYAVGDANGKALFAHAARREAIIALVNIHHRKKEHMDFDLVPWAVFTNPPVAGVGLSERKANEKRFKIGILEARFTSPARAHIIDDTRGFVKVIYDRKSRKILGCVIIGPGADNLIHEYVAVMQSSSPTIDTIKRTIHIRPTLPEVMESLKDRF